MTERFSAHASTVEASRQINPDPGRAQPGTFDVQGTATRVEGYAKDVLHTAEHGPGAESARERLRQSLTSLTKDEQQQVAAQIKKDNGNFDSLPRIDLDFTRDGHILGMVIHASRLDFGADHQAEGINITPVPIEELPGYGTGPLD